MSTERIRDYLAGHWRNVAIYGALFILLGSALLWRLSSLVPGYSQDEVATYNAAQSLHALLHDPANAPFLLVVKGVGYLIPHSYLPARIVAAVLGLVTLIVMARLLHRWQDMRTAIIGTLLFGLSAWFLHVSRYGSPEVLSFGIYVLAACGFWAKQTSSWLALGICFVLAALLLYTPGMVWFIGLGIIWQWRTLDNLFKRHLLTVTLAGLVLLGMIAPIGWAIYKQHHLAYTFLGFPSQLPGIRTVLLNIAKFPYHFLVHNSANPALWLGTAPILDAYSATALVLGTYLYIRHARLGRAPIFFSVIALTVILTALGSPITFSIVMPFIYVLIAIGTSYILDVWFKTFPRNPIARGTGWLLMGSLLALVCAYQATQYFIGWPHAQETYNTFISSKRP